MGKNEAGMYGQTPRVKVGEFTIAEDKEGVIWIEREDGEGGQFSEKDFEKAIDVFFEKNF